jgi:predicted Ser/Thr protein kinase
VGNPNPVEDIEDKTVNWLQTLVKLTQDGKLVHKKKGVVIVQEKVVQLTEKKRLGLFKSDRENDALSGALGNAEHT